MPFSEGDEADAVDKLRRDGDLTLSLVAEDKGAVVGHIAFSPVTAGEGSFDWYGLGPVSVWPERQKGGVGTALITTGLTALQELSAQGCVLIGDPVYYFRFGFVGDGRLSYRDLRKEYVQWLAFGDAKPSGVLKFSPGLE